MLEGIAAFERIFHFIYIYISKKIINVGISPQYM